MSHFRFPADILGFEPPAFYDFFVAVLREIRAILERLYLDTLHRSPTARAQLVV